MHTGEGDRVNAVAKDAIVVLGSLLRSERHHLSKARNAPGYLTAQAHRGSAAHCLAIADRVTEICEDAQV